MGLRFILQHLDSPGTYARILFVEFNSAFNAIAPALLRDKLTQLSAPEPTCRWITDFLTDRKQRVRLGKLVPELRTISTGAPQGCVLSPLHKQRHLQPPLCQTPEICRRHNPHWINLQWGRGCLQRGSLIDSDRF